MKLLIWILNTRPVAALVFWYMIRRARRMAAAPKATAANRELSTARVNEAGKVVT